MRCGMKVGRLRRAYRSIATLIKLRQAKAPVSIAPASIARGLTNVTSVTSFGRPPHLAKMSLCPGHQRIALGRPSGQRRLGRDHVGELREQQQQDSHRSCRPRRHVVPPHGRGNLMLQGRFS